MKYQTQKQRHIINRLMYLLEEASVSQASKDDPQFARYIDHLYDDLDTQSVHLDRPTV